MKENTCVGRIALEKLHNTRDLGGYKTIDGRQLMSGRLLRSGTLYGASENDIRILTEKYCLGTIVDFRTATERSQKPDPEISGVANQFNPILNEQTVGITFEEEKTDVDRKHEDVQIEILKHAMSLFGNPQLYIDKLYEDLILNSHAAKQYGNFFDILLNADERAVLWHCTAGKDRVGIGTALLLTALGVERDTIIRDFLKTNDYVMKDVEMVVKTVQEKTGDDKMTECVRALLTVSKEAICHAFTAMETTWGTADAYLQQQIGLTFEKQELLRSKFLVEV